MAAPGGGNPQPSPTAPTGGKGRPPVRRPLARRKKEAWAPRAPPVGQRAAARGKTGLGGGGLGGESKKGENLAKTEKGGGPVGSRAGREDSGGAEKGCRATRAGGGGGEAEKGSGEV